VDFLAGMRKSSYASICYSNGQTLTALISEEVWQKRSKEKEREIRAISQTTGYQGLKNATDLK
jgi:hypothetical protein